MASSPLAAEPSADVAVGAPTPLPTLPQTPYPPAEAVKAWRTIVPKVTSGDFVSVEGLKPPSGVYLLDWILPERCTGILTNDSDNWGWGYHRAGGSLGGLDLADLTTEYPYSAFTVHGCDPWVLSIKPVGTWFGPNSVQVARLLIRLQALAITWGEVNQETVSAESATLETRVLDAAKRDPNLGAAVQHALAMDWYRGNNYVLDQPNAARLRRLAILAEVAQGLLTGAEFDTLYGPMAGFIDPLSLGLPMSP
jgi:hypothetical protein